MIQMALGGEEWSGGPRGKRGMGNIPRLQEVAAATESRLAMSCLQGNAWRRESFPDPHDFLPALGMDLAST